MKLLIQWLDDFAKKRLSRQGYTISKNSVTTFTTSGEWIKPSGCNSVTIKVEGGGGGGGSGYAGRRP